MSMPVIRLRQSVQFPANVYGDTGIDVTKTNGNYTITTDWSDFATLLDVPTSPTNNVLTYDTNTQEYVMVPTSLLGGGGGGGTAVPPATVAPIMDGTAAVGVATKYAREDHVHPSDTSRASLASPALTGVPTAPTAAPATNTTQLATTAFVTAAVTASGGVTPSALTRTSDTNVTLTLGGTPATALLQPTSITVGWTGTLSAARGGFGADVSSTTGVPLFTSGVAAFTATSGTGNFVRTVGPTLSGVPVAPTAATGTNTTQIATTAFVVAQAVAKTGDTMSGALTTSSTLSATGNIFTGGGYFSAGLLALQQTGGYTVLYDNTSAICISLGNTGDKTNYHDQDNHKFRSTGGSVEFVIFRSSGTFNVSGSWTALSARELKQDIAPYTRGLDAVRELNPVMFRYRPDTPFARSQTEPSDLHIGLVAEDVAPHLPEVVGTTNATVGKAELTVATLQPSNIIYALINTVKELADRIEALEGKLG